MRYQETMIAIFPRDMLIKRVEDGEEPNLAELYQGVVEEVQRIVASGEFA